MQVSAEDIRVVARLVQDLCGIVLDESKGYLIKSRLSELSHKTGCRTFCELYYKAQYGNDTALRNAIIDAIATNETLFFRDTSPFDALQQKVLPELLETKSKSAFPKRIRIWSAACSTGQEPYSIAMTLSEALGDLRKWDISIYASDISETALRQARAGRYTETEIRRGMKRELLEKYFLKQDDAWVAKSELRHPIRFERRNLMEPFTSLGPFDIIFCRNVAIYFSPQARQDLFQRMTQTLAPHGSLFVGGSESLRDLGKTFLPITYGRATYYRPNHSGKPIRV